MAAERWLKILLVYFGGVAALAVVPMVMPWGWMAAVHEWLGMGELEHRPVVEYMARGMSGLSAFYGGLLLVLASDVVRYRRIIRYQALAMMVLGAVSLPFSYSGGMPVWWVAGEVGSCWVFGGAMAWLVGRIGG